MVRLIIPLLMLVAVSCRNTGTDEQRRAVARAGDRVLYIDEIPSGLVTQGMSKEDSTSAVQSYIRRWARKELMALRAERTSPPNTRQRLTGSSMKCEITSSSTSTSSR